MNWPLHSGRSSTLTDNLDYSSSNAIVSTKDQLLYLAKFLLLRSRLSSKTVTTSLTDTAMLNLGLVFCRCRFLNSVTYSLLQRLQKCSSGNSRYFRLSGRSSNDTDGQLSLFDFLSPPAVIIFVFRTSSDLVSTVLQDHLTICTS